MASKNKLEMGGGLQLPIDAATEKFAFLGMSGSGKSNGLVVMAEEFYRLGVPFVTFDPKGDWYGLRAAADGKGEGLDVPIFGAVQIRKRNKPKPDLPLEPTSGRFLAELVVRERLSCILDVAGFDSDADRSRFLKDFGDRLFRLNEEPLMLFLEEVDEYAPQSPQGADKQTLHIFKRIQKQGRNAGLGTALASQRSAVVNKTVLNQAETLIASRTTGPRDKQAIAEWLQSKGQGQEVVEALPTLADGEVFVVSPRLLGEPRKVQLRRRWTFDSGATPKVGEKRRAVTLSGIDLSKVQEQMAEAIEAAKDSDPDELRKQLTVQKRERAKDVQRIQELERQLEQRPEEVEVRHVNVPVLDEGVADKLAALLTEMREAVAPVMAATDKTFRWCEETAGEIGKARSEFAEVEPAPPPPRRTQVIDAEEQAVRQHERRPLEERADYVDEEPKLSKPEVAFLQILYQFPKGKSKAQLAVLSGYSLKSSTIKNGIGALRSKGFVSPAMVDPITITQAGAAALEFAGKVPDTAPAGGRALLDHWKNQLPGAFASVLQVMVDAWPTILDKAAIAESTGYSPDSSTIKNALGRLRTLELVHGWEPAQELLEP